MFWVPMSCIIIFGITFADVNLRVHSKPANLQNFDVGASCRMCEFALASYCCGNLGHGVADWSCDACKKQPQMINITVVSSGINLDANGFVGYDPIQNAIIIAFAGTDPLSIENWIDDLNAIKIPYPLSQNCVNCSVHKGFYDTYMAVRDQVWNAVNKLYHYYGPNTNLQITGHSLGAALATHCGLDGVITYGIQPNYVWTFGQPRVGNYNFAAYQDSLINVHYRVTHRKDPVPHVPNESMGFYHTVLEVFYPELPNSTNYMVCDGSGEDPKCSDKYLVDLDVADHLDYQGFDFTANYLSCKI